MAQSSGDANCDKSTHPAPNQVNPNPTTGAGGGMGSPGGIFLRSKFRSALNSSNDIFSSISNRLSLLSHNSSSSHTSETPPQLPTTPPEQQQTMATREWVEGACANAGDGDVPSSPESRNSLTMTRLKEKFKLENLQGNLQDLRPTLEDLMAPDLSSEPSTLPTNTPPYSPGLGERLRAAINPALEKKLEDYKAMAIRTLSGETTGGVLGGRPPPSSKPNCAIKVDLVADLHHPTATKPQGGTREGNGDGNSVCVSSRSITSIHSLRATGPDPYDKLKYKHTLSSGSVSDANGGHSVSLDSTDSDPHKKLWIRDGSQNSLQSWASSLSYDSQAEDSTNPKEFMKNFVECVFKAPNGITPDKKNLFGEMAKSEFGRLWFARCINGKRCCRCVTEATFLALVQHFTLVLKECADADDFSPAKSLMNMCFTYYFEPKTDEMTTSISSGHNNPTQSPKEFLYVYLRQQPIWTSLRFWNAAFFDALQCERSLRPVATRQELGGPADQAVQDELHYQENITFGQLGTFTCNMHAFGLSQEMVSEFLRKQVTIASLRSEQVKLLRDNVNRLYSEQPEWK